MIQANTFGFLIATSWSFKNAEKSKHIEKFGEARKMSSTSSSSFFQSEDELDYYEPID